MARRPPKQCPCGGLIQDGRCSSVQCQQRREARAARRLACADRNRSSSTDRGYDGAWRKTAAAYLKANPLCACCAAKGRDRAANLVDHIEPFRVDDPVQFSQLRLDWNNLQSLCGECHNRDKKRIEWKARISGGSVRQLWTAYLQELQRLHGVCT